jgi:hypothetical protein
MQPNTKHCVLTVDDSIMSGRHFLSCSTMQATLCGIVHTFVLNYAATNSLHRGFGGMMNRMMFMWTDFYFSHLERRVSNPHVPNICKREGLLDFMALGNIIELATVLDRDFYESDKHRKEKEIEISIARLRYRSFQSFFARRYQIKINGKSIHPLVIFQRSLVDLAATIVFYMEDTKDCPRDPPDSTASLVKHRIDELFKTFPEFMSSAFERRVSQPPRFLHWTGPEFEILPIVEMDPQLLDFEDFPLYTA